MTRHRVSASARIPGAPARVYDVLADYRGAHRHILPERFSEVTVERGGFGAGTIIRFRLRVGGRTRTLRAAITEPDPGRVLAETNLEGKMAVTTFTVAPDPAATFSNVTIATELPVRSGMIGAIERCMTTHVLEPMHREELRRLAAFMSGDASPGSSWPAARRCGWEDGRRQRALAVDEPLRQQVFDLRVAP